MKIVYLIAATIVPTVPASFLTWTETAFYDSYAHAPRMWGISAVLDAQIAGLVMKLGGGAILWSFIIVIFARWTITETRTERPERTPPTDVPVSSRPRCGARDLNAPASSISDSPNMSPPFRNLFAM